MKQEITIKVTFSELLTLIKSYPKEVSISEAHRIKELQAIYNKAIRQHNRTVSLFEVKENI